ncbi:GNAT family N-acetyltransferase [Parasalinivibrio latis]|uniref:GNAT family N-acetyltransferase n=1 Tax=Parasalinivibrio latis TaxID=2952610 RepID=UPI0030E3F76E
MSKLTIREAQPRDVTTVHQLIHALAEDHGESDIITVTVSQLERALFGDHPKFGVLLAELGGKTAGFLSYMWRFSTWSGTEYLHVDDLFVNAEFRSMGVGEALMLEARERCFSTGRKYMRWEVQENNERGIRFYKRLGAKVKIVGVCRWQ